MVSAPAWLPAPDEKFSRVGARRAALALPLNGFGFGAPLLPDAAGFSPDQRLHTPAEFGRVFAEPARSSVDAIAQGTRDGIVLLVNIAAMLIVAVALVALANKLLASAVAPFGIALTIEQILGWILAPLAWLIGVPWSECGTAGSLIGIKTVLNEFIAYLKLAETPTEALSERSRLLMTYALCGFANLGSLGIMIGGMAAMAPERRSEIAGLGAKTIVSGTLATLMTAAVVGVLTPP